MTKADEQKCPTHDRFLVLWSRLRDPGGPIVQEPVPESFWECPEPKCGYRVPPAVTDQRETDDADTEDELG